MKELFYEYLLELSKIMEVTRTILWKFLTILMLVIEGLVYLVTDFNGFPTVMIMALTIIVMYMLTSMIHNGSVEINKWVKNQLTPKDE